MKLMHREYQLTALVGRYLFENVPLESHRARDRHLVRLSHDLPAIVCEHRSEAPECFRQWQTNLVHQHEFGQ